MNSLEKNIRSIFTILLVGVSLFAHGQSTIWVYSGSGSPSWHNASHWSQGVPNAFFVAIIPENNSNTYPIINPQSDVGVATARTIIINSGASLTGQSGSSLQVSTLGGSVGILNQGTINCNGDIVIDGGSTATPTGLNNAGTFNLTGSLEINGLGNSLSDEAVLNDGQFTINNGTLKIGNGSEIDGAGIVNNSNFNVNAGGDVFIDRNVEGAIDNGVDGTFTNSGSIRIGTLTSILNGSNVGIKNLGTFTNNANIEIKDATLHGIFNMGDLTLDGEVNMTSCGPIGIYNFLSSAQINLESNLNLFIDGQVSGYVGIRNEGSIIMDPGGEVYIESSADAIRNNKTLSINGKITINVNPDSQADAIQNTDFINLVSPCNALLHITSNAPINNSGTIINDGVIRYEGIKPSNITINRELVISTEGDHISIDTDNGSYVTGDKNVWLGCESSSWSQAENWSDNELPDVNSDVVIIDHGGHDPQLSITANVSTVLVDESTVLSINSSGDLTCNGSTDHSLTIIGQVTNSGYIRISNNSNNTGIDCQGMLTSGGIIVVSECQLGINNDGVILIPNNGNIFIDDVSSVGILNDGTFTTDGQIFIGVITPFSGNAIENNSDFIVGSHCRTSIEINSNTPILDNSNFVNGGIINYNGTQNSNISTNNGFVVSKQGDYFSIAIDNGLYAQDDYVVWTGCNSTYWFDGLNWTRTSSPLSSDNVLITGNVPNDPELDITVNIGTLEIAESALFHLPEDGIINLSGSDKNSIEINGSLLNEGTISISNNSSKRGISCKGIFMNRGTVGISNCKFAIYIEENSEFENDEEGIANIDDGTEGLTSYAEIINKGAINIENVNIGININSIFTNEINSSLNIDNYTFAGYITGGPFLNKGIIDVGQNLSLWKFGFEIEEVTFTNMSTGIINIYNYRGTGLYLDEAIFTNHGNILFENGIGKSIDDHYNSIFTNTNSIVIGAENYPNAEMSFYGPFTNTVAGSITSSSSFGIDLHYKNAFSNDGLIQIEGDVTSDATGNISGSGSIALEGDWSTNGSHDMDEMTITFKGSGNSNLNTALTLDKLVVNKENNELLLNGNQDIVSEIEMISGILNLNGNTIELTTGASIQGENENTYIYDQAPTFGGSIIYSESLNSPSSKNLGNLGCIVTSDGNLGQFTVVRSHNPLVANGITTINRNFDIDYANPTADVDIDFEYLEHEISTFDESTFGVYKYTDAMDLIEYAVSASSVFTNTIKISGQNILGTFSFGESDKTMYWTGSEDEDWYNPLNWSIFGIPNKNYDVIIPDVANDPLITDPLVTAEIKSLILMEDAVLTNNGNLLSVNSDTVGIIIHGKYLSSAESSSIVFASAENGFHITQSGTFTNDGFISKFMFGTIGGSYILNDGLLRNTGLILIAKQGETPIENNPSGTIINNGVIDIALDELGNFTGIAGIHNKGTFLTSSSSEIEVRYLDKLAILNDNNAYFENRGIIEIGKKATSNIVGNGIENLGIVNNYGRINIDHVTQSGILNDGGVFENYDTLDIGQSFNNSIGHHGIRSNSEFHSLGVINIGSTGENGIYITGANSNFTNTAEINLGLTKPIGTNGIHVEEMAEFTNLLDGVIDIKNADNGVKIASQTSGSSGSFENFGDLYFSEITNFGIDNNDVFTNTGLIGGNGNIKSTTVELEGTISPGLSPGLFYFISEIQAQPGSVLVIEVDGINPVEHDRIQSEEFFTISNMALDVQINYTPQDGDRIVFLEAAVVIGEFASLINSLPAGWTIDYGGEYVALEFATVLPVELLSFDAKLNDRSVNLDWKTASEVNNEGFEILHSTDVKDWKEIGFVQGFGNTQQIQEYGFDHTDPVQGNNYYKLRQVDFDGAYTDSEIRVVKFEGREKAVFVELYPNPTIDYINLRWDHNQHAFSNIQIVDIKGQLLEDINADSVDGILQIDIKALPTGHYNLILIDHNQVMAKRFSKMGF